jgi:COMPASS component SWD1
MIARHRIQGVQSQTIKSIEITNSGLYLFTNSTDRVIRQFVLPTYSTISSEEGEYVEQELEPTLRLHDPVNRVSWSSIGISSSGRWVAGGYSSPLGLLNSKNFCHQGVSGGAGHKIYIWDASNGRYVTTLDGGGVSLTSLQVGQ